MPGKFKRDDMDGLKPYSEKYGSFNGRLGASDPETRGRCKAVSYSSEAVEEQALCKRTPLDEVIEKEDLQLFLSRLKSFEDIDRKILQDSVIHRKTLREIATDMNLPRSTVHSRLKKAMEQFAKAGMWSVVGLIGVIVATGGPQSGVYSSLTNSSSVMVIVLFSLFFISAAIAFTPIILAWLNERRFRNQFPEAEELTPLIKPIVIDPITEDQFISLDAYRNMRNQFAHSWRHPTKSNRK